MRHLFIVVFIVTFLPTLASAQVVISEVFYNPAETPEHNYEFVEVYNTGAQTDISNWILKDDSKEYVIPSGTILEGGTYFIINRALVSNGFSLKNTGETLVLKSNSDIQDTKIYTDDAEEGESLQRQLNGTWLPAAPTPDSGLPVVDTDSGTQQQGQNQAYTTTEIIKYDTVTIEPPQDIFVRDILPATILAGSVFYIEPEVYDATGSVADAQCYIALGDGAESKKCKTTHLYEYAGEYIIHITVQKGTLHDSTSFAIEVLEPEFLISVEEDGKYIEIYNALDNRVELSEWRVKVGYKTFMIPTNTIISAQSSIKISARVMQIDITRYGGVAKLVNAFNKVAADSSSQPQPTVQAQDTILEVTEQEQAIIQEETTIDVPIPPVQALQVTKPVPNSNITKSIVGVHISDIAEQEYSKELVATVSNAILSKSGTKSIETEAVPWRRVVPQEPGKWIVGLLALLGIVMVPVFVGRGDPENES